jgi:hypothetical protein
MFPTANITAHLVSALITSSTLLPSGVPVQIYDLSGYSHGARQEEIAKTENTIDGTVASKSAKPPFNQPPIESSLLQKGLGESVNKIA